MRTLVENIEGFDIYFEALEETLPLDSNEYEEMSKAVESGELVVFVAHVTAYKKGIELGDDYLGACIYKSYEEFYTIYKDDYYSDMRRNAIEEAKKAIKSLTEN